MEGVWKRLQDAKSNWNLPSAVDEFPVGGLSSRCRWGAAPNNPRRQRPLVPRQEGATTV
jgi:hypothetical protein